LEARNDGLYVERKLNKLGIENDAEGFFPYPSIGWFVRSIGNGRVVPELLDHVGMVQHPNIKNVPAWTNESPLPEPGNNPQQNDMNLKAIALALGLADTATEAEILAAIDKLKTSCSTAATEVENSKKAMNQAIAERDQHKTLATNEQTAATGLKTDLTKANNERVEAVLQLAINEGRIKPADKAAWVARFSADATKATNELAAIKPRVNVTPLLINRAEREHRHMAVNEANERLKTLAEAVLTKHKNDPRKAFAAVCADPANKALVMAANGTPEE